MQRKPNQIIDEITGAIYPPPEAIVAQLNTIRAIIAPTVKMYENTEDIHTIQPNLDMIQRAICYLRGAPPIEIPDPDAPEPEPDPRDPAAVVFTDPPLKTEIKSYWDPTGESKFISIYVKGSDLTPENEYPDLFGASLPEETVCMNINLPVEDGKKYHIAQVNPALSNFADDPSISEVNGQWVKKKDYEAPVDDNFEYIFLIPDGQHTIRITLYNLTDDELVADYYIITECEINGKDDSNNG